MLPAATSSAVAKTSSEKCEIDKKRKEKEKEKKPVNEIEEIFRAAKKKRKELPPPPSSSSAEKKANKKSPKMKTKKESKNSGEEGSLRKRRKTADGLTIYSAEELGVGNPDAGGTGLCPFECSCCY